MYHSQIRCIALGVCKLRMGFLFRHSLEWGGVNANHNATHSLSLAGKNKTANDFRLLKNSEGNRDDEWNFCRGQEANLALFFQCKRHEWESSENLRRKLVDYCPKQGRHHRNKNKVDRNAPITSKHVSPKRFAKMIDGTEKPKILRSLQNAQRDTTNLAISPSHISQWMHRTTTEHVPYREGL